MKRIIIQKEPLDIAASLDAFGSDADGAIVSFIGRARDHSRGQTVLYLEYEIYERMAKNELEKIADEALAQWPINSCLIIHRFGRVAISEVSILICVSSPHREEAFTSVRFIIDTIKKTVPIWKKEFYTDGSRWISERS